MYAGCSVLACRGLQRRHLQVGCEQCDEDWLQCVFPSPCSLHRAFACHRALRLRMGIMGEYGARTRGMGRFRLSLGLRRACVRVGAVFQDAEAFNGDLSKWKVSSVTHMDYSASSPRPTLFIVSLPAIVLCAYAWASWGSVGPKPATWGGLGRACFFILPLPAIVLCAYVWASWCAVFDGVPGPCKCFHGPFNSKCHTCSACHPSGKPCK